MLKKKELDQRSNEVKENCKSARDTNLTIQENRLGVRDANLTI